MATSDTVGTTQLCQAPTHWKILHKHRSFMAYPPLHPPGPFPGDSWGWQHISYSLPAVTNPALSWGHVGMWGASPTALHPHPARPCCKHVPSTDGLQGCRSRHVWGQDPALLRAAVDMIKYINRKPPVFRSVGHHINSQPDRSSAAEQALRRTRGQHGTRAGANQTFHSQGSTATGNQCWDQVFSFTQRNQHLEMSQDGEGICSFHFRIVAVFFFFFCRWV